METREAGSAIAFRVDGTPVPKARARVGRNGGHTPERTKGWEHSVAWSCRLAMRERDAFECEVTVALVFTIGRTQIADIDNLTKSLLDAMNGVAYLDDKQVIRLAVELWRGDRVGVDVQVTPAHQTTAVASSAR